MLRPYGPTRERYSGTLLDGGIRVDPPFTALRHCGRYWGHSDQIWILARDGYDVIDPQQTLNPLGLNAHKPEHSTFVTFLAFGNE